jgi:hypothetical protein
VSIGLVATCNPQGAGRWPRLSDDSVLNGRRVVTIQDKDDAGRKHSVDVASRLHGRAAEVRIVETPDISKGPAEWIGACDALTAKQFIDHLEAVDPRGNCDGIRPPLGISGTPVLRAAGSIWQMPGYHAITADSRYHPPTVRRSINPEDNSDFINRPAYLILHRRKRGCRRFSS